MAIELATAYISLVPSTKGIMSQLQHEMGAPIQKQAEETSSKVGATFKKMAVVAGGAFAAIGVGTFLKSTITSASDLAETVNKSNVIFGKNAAEIDAWSKNSAKAFGQSRQKALESVATFGDMFSQIGFTGEAAASMSKDIVQMSADFGSFNNLPTADVQERISAAFRGELDPIQKIIPAITAARVQQEAMAATGKTNAESLTAQEKAAATLAIIHKDGARAAGDFARTSTGLANQQKILGAQFEDVKTKIGAALLPIMLKLVTFLTTDLGPVIDTIKDGIAFLGRNMDIIGPILIGLAFVIGVPLVAAFVAWAIAAGAAAIATITAMAPVIAIGLAVAALVAGFVYAYQHFDLFRAAIDKIVDAIKLYFIFYFELAKFVVQGLIDYVKLIIRVVTDVVQGIQAIFRGDWKEAWAKFSDIPMAVIDFVKGRLQGLIDFVGTIGSKISKLTAGMWDGLKDAFRAALNWIIAAWNKTEFKVRGVKAFGIEVGGFVLGMPDIPLLGAGGIVTKPTLAMIGERGPEAVIPLSAASASLGMAQAPIVNVYIGDEPVVHAVQSYSAHNGPGWLERLLGQQ